MDQETIDAILVRLSDWGLRIIFALIIFYVGTWIAKKVKEILTNLMNKKEIDPTLVGFLANIAYGAIVVFVVIAAISKLGVNTTSFAAVIAAAGLAIGLALQGSLSNFASGVLIIIFKPFKAGDFIVAGGETGIVVDVGLLATEMKTGDNIKIILPNSSAMGGSIKNFSAHPTRRVDMTIGVGYGDNLSKAKEVIEAVIAADERVLKDPEPVVAVANLGDSSVDFVVRPWVNAADYWGFKFDFTKAIKERLDEEGISIPYPQRDVHLFQETAS